ncbi:MAG: putative sterol carrier protein, partial [Glaciecola sp.]
FEGEETIQTTAVIAEGKITVEMGLVGKPDLRMLADSKTWVAFLRKDIGLPRALLTRKVKLSGDPRLLLAFAKCFPN